MAVSQEKISVHSLADLKNTSDDALPVYLNSIGFKQSHILSDIRLALGYTAFAICAATFYWDYKFGFEATKSYTAIAVALYACINGILTFWIWGVEKGKVYVGTNKDGQYIEVSTSTRKHVPIYSVKVTTQTSAGRVTKIIAKPFSNWFDAAGHFVSAPFQDMLALSVPLIATLDPQAGLRTKKEPDAEQLDDGKTMDEKWASLLAESEGLDGSVGAISSATPASKGKRRAKKAA